MTQAVPTDNIDAGKKTPRMGTKTKKEIELLKQEIEDLKEKLNIDRYAII